MKSMARSLFVDPETVDAVPVVNAPSANVTVRLLTSLLFAWFAARPVSVRVTTVLLVRAKLAVSPPGTLLADTWSTASLVNVSPVSVAVTLPVTEPSLAAASVKLPA